MLSRFLRLFIALLLTSILAACGGSQSPQANNAPGSSAASGAAPAINATYVAPRTGWFWNPSEGGRGFAIEQQGNQLYFMGMLYESYGDATWYASTMSAQPDGSYSGDLLRYTGGQTLLGSYQPPNTPVKIANIQAMFISNTQGTLIVKDVNSSATRTISIQTFSFSSQGLSAPTTAAFQNGWWWNESQGGRGYFIETQGAQAFIGSFMYQSNGQPIWYVSYANLLNPMRVSGSLLVYSGGQSLYSNFQAATQSPSSPGVMSFDLTSPTTGIMTLPDGTQIPVKRFVFNNAQVTPEVPRNLMISEVSSTYYTNSSNWFEVYNPNSQTSINLADYTLNSSYLDSSAGKIYSTPTSFSLPAVTIPPKSYLVIAGKSMANLNNNNQMVYISNQNLIPFWNQSGFIELVKNGATADVVRFGSSTASPTTAGAWSGNNAPALPYAANQYGYSIVRLASGGMADTNTGADWTYVNFSTPGGPNDIGPNVIDSDGDGIPDNAKVSGQTYAGLDLYSLGARPGQRDIFIQIDHMDSTDPGVVPRQEALQKLVDTFANKTYSPGKKKIMLHIDAGNLFSKTINPALFNLGGGQTLPFSPCLDMQTSQPVASGCVNLFDFKRTNLDVRRRPIFHYVVMGNSRQTDGNCGSSGYGEINGNDFIITLGGCSMSTSSPSSLNYLINAQAATIMHEFGHNLGLQHGGFESNNYKPNYYSIMNYLYQFKGLSANPSGPLAANRFYLQYRSSYMLATGLNICNIDNSPCGSNFIMDYSNGSSQNLDENNLSEALNIGRGSTNGAFADWDNSGDLTPGTYAMGIHNNDTTNILGVLKDNNDWDNLILPFARGFNGASSGNNPKSEQSLRSVARKNPMSDQAFQLIEEDPSIVRQHMEALRAAHQ